MESEVKKVVSQATDKGMVPWIDTGSPWPIIRKDMEVFPEEYAFVLYNVLSPDECNYYIKTIEELGLDDVDLHYKKEFRNSHRAVVKGEEVARVIWDRVKLHVRDIEITEDNDHFVGIGPGQEGIWKPMGLNIVWRFGKYQAGGHFGPHYDGVLVRSPIERSMKTFMLYLNDDFEGGTTNFLEESLSIKDPITGINRADEKHILRKIEPVQGMAILFNHQLYHEGGKLLNGVKYIMRTDILFQKSENKDK